MKDVLKPPKRRGTKSQRKSLWLRPEVLHMAFAVLQLISWVAKLLDWFQR